MKIIQRYNNNKKWKIQLETKQNVNEETQNSISELMMFVFLSTTI